jgi:hypothetical protein
MQELNPVEPLRHAMHVDVSDARDDFRSRFEAASAGAATATEGPPR